MAQTTSDPQKRSGGATTKASKNDRREAARLQAEKLRAEQARKEKRSRIIMFSILGAMLAVLVGVGLWIASLAGATLLDDFDGNAPQTGDVNGGILVGAGGVGEPSADAVDMQVYIDFMCVYCQMFEDTNATDIAELVEAGDLNVSYHLVANLTDTSLRTANAAITVAEEQPESFVDFMVGIFEVRPTDLGGLTDEQIAEIAIGVGVSQDVVDTFTDGAYNEWVETASRQAVRDGATGTPTVKIDGEILDSREVTYMEPGVLRAHLEEQIAS